MKKILILVSVLILIGCNNDTKTNDVDKLGIENQSLEYKFSIVNAGKYIPEDDPTVNHSRELLDRAAKEYGEAPDKIADMTVAAANAGKKENINVTALEVLEAGAVCYIGEGTPEFAKVIAMYLAVRKGGQSHTEAVVGLKGILNIATGK